MKILITGSNGLLGQKLVYALLNKENVVLIASSKGNNRILKKQGYTYESLDITSREEVKEILYRHRPDVIINTAAMTNVDACETNKEDCWNLNVRAVENLVKVSEELEQKGHAVHFIHLSTDFIFDGEAGPYKEEDQPNPVSYYGLSKYEAEKIVSKTVLKKWAILRTIIVYGIVDNMSRTNIVLWAKDALEKKQKINVVDDQFRSPTLAEDLAQGCILTAEKGASGIYNISGKEIMSVLELVYGVADFFELDKSFINPIKSNTLNQPAKRPPKTGFILDKAYRHLGYKPHAFKEGLAVIAEQLKKMASFDPK